MWILDIKRVPCIGGYGTEYKLKLSPEMVGPVIGKEWWENLIKMKENEEEMKERLEKIMDVSEMQISTFHSFCHDVLGDNVLDSGIGIGGIKVTGSIDRVELTPKGEYQVIDFKTGSIYETKNSIKEDTQMNVYALAVQKLYEKLPEKASLFYLKENKVLENEIKTDSLNKVKTTLETVVKSILDEDFQARPTKGACFSCSFKDICDFVESD